MEEVIDITFTHKPIPEVRRMIEENVRAIVKPYIEETERLRAELTTVKTERDAARDDHLQTAEVLSHLQMASVKKDLEIMRLRDVLECIKNKAYYEPYSAEKARAALEAKP